MTGRRLRRFGALLRCGFALLITALLVAVLWRESRAVEAANDRIAYTIASNIQHVNQTQGEALQFLRALGDFELGRVGIDTVLLRFDLMWNQVDVLGTQAVAADPEIAAVVARFRTCLEAAEARLVGLGRGDADVIEALRTDFEGVRQELKRVWMLGYPGRGYRPLADRVVGPELDRKTLEIGLISVLSAFILYLLVEVALAVRERERERELARLATAGDRAKTDFLALLSHEIRTPMNGVLGMAALLDTTPLDERQRVFVSTIRSSGRILLQLINDILQFATIDSGQMKLAAERAPVLPVAYDPAMLMAPRAREKGLDLVVRIAPEVPRTLVCDAARLTQVVGNLLGNAVKFTEKGEIELALSVEPGAGERIVLVVTVRDTGPGIAEAHRARVFEKFFQAERARGGVQDGAGLGLAICAGLVRMMGGTIGVTSRLGEGSCFRVAVPLGRVADEDERAIGPVCLGGETVAVVDPNPGGRAALADLVTAWGGVVVPVDPLSEVPGPHRPSAVIERIGHASGRGLQDHAGARLARAAGVRWLCLAGPDERHDTEPGDDTVVMLPDPAPPDMLRAALVDVLCRTRPRAMARA